MKQFLYLDTDIVNSIIAQADQGQIQLSVSETSATTTNTNTLNCGIEGTALIGGSAFKLDKAEANIKADIAGSLGNTLLVLCLILIKRIIRDKHMTVLTKR